MKKSRNYVPGAAIGIAVALILSVAFYDLDIVSLWLMVLMLPGAKIYEKRVEERRKEELLSEFKDGLSYAKNALDAGDSAENAFGAAVLPLKKLYGEDALITRSFREICRKVQNGTPLEEAFSDFSKKARVRDIQDFAEVFPVLKRTGGDMNIFVSREIKNISDKQSLNREINVVTAGKRNEFHIMCVIPVSMILYLKIFSGDMMAGLYHNTRGIVFMTVMIFLYAACILGGQWILKRHLG